MKKPDTLDDLPTNLSANERFQSVVERAVSRRGFLKSGLGLSAVTFLSGSLAACTSDDDTPVAGLRPPGRPCACACHGTAPRPPPSPRRAAMRSSSRGLFGADLRSLGIAAVQRLSAWRPDGTNTGEEQARRVGDNHDRMSYFPIDGSNEGLLVMNHEYCNYEVSVWRRIRDAVDGRQDLKALNAHGVSVLHVKKDGAGRWGSPHHRLALQPPDHRQDADDATGPAAGDALLRTTAGPSGPNVLGTLNNCANGKTLWNTHLTCEENFNGYFATSSEPGTDAPTAFRPVTASAPAVPATAGTSMRTALTTPRNPTRPTASAGSSRSIPFEPGSTPKKRTALGRFA